MTDKMNGFYPMLNDVHDKAVKDLPLAECALFEHIWRKLIGWNQFEDEISISQLVKETSACRATIINLLNKLEEKRWILINRNTSKTNRKLTNEIALPRCPGIESRLGWSNKYTRGSTDSIPGGSLESRHTTDSLPTDSLQTSKVEPPQIFSPKQGLSDMVNIQSALYHKWGMRKVKAKDIENMLSSVTLFAGGTGQDPTTRKEVEIKARYAPIDFWFDMINQMTAKPNHVNAVIKYAKKAWPDYKRRNKLS